ncbi:hypothetical protein Trydic_g10706 [Trypoxylus dichotomus]
MDVNRRQRDLCRICSSEYENGINVFEEEGRRLYLQAKIRKYLYITISMDDKLPKIICENCCKKLEGIHKFAMMAIKIQDKLNKLVVNTTNKTYEKKKGESKGLLHTYLTKPPSLINTQGVKENKSYQDLEVTEMEIRVDPMIVLQCSILDDDEEDENGYSSDNSEIDEKPTITNNIAGKSYYPCLVCPKRFASELALQEHMWTHNQKPKRILLTNYDNLIYGETQNNLIKTENGESNLADHGNGIRFNCPICGKIISTKGNLKVHLETHRPKGKYACDICGRIFKTQCNLHRHKEYHEGIQFPCNVCGRVYPTNSTLRAHSITHSDLRPHKCPLCDKTFKRNQDLKFHINQHTGARPYQCPYCPKAFASSGNCFSHRKRMHPLEVERDRERAANIMR